MISSNELVTRIHHLVKKMFCPNQNDGLSSHNAPEVAQMHWTKASQLKSNFPVIQLTSWNVDMPWDWDKGWKPWYTLWGKGKLSDVSKVGDSNVEMEMQDNAILSQANVSSVERTQKRKDKSLMACPRPTELVSKAEKQYANYIAKFADAKVPYMLPSQKLDLYLQNLDMPHLECFDDRLKIYHQTFEFSNSLWKQALFFQKSVEDWIKESPLLTEIDLDAPIVVWGNGKDQKEFPSIQSIIDYHFFTISEVIETMKLLVADPATAYNKLCKTYIEQKRELIQVITWHVWKN